MRNYSYMYSTLFVRYQLGQSVIYVCVTAQILETSCVILLY